MRFHSLSCQPAHRNEEFSPPASWCRLPASLPREGSLVQRAGGSAVPPATGKTITTTTKTNLLNVCIKDSFFKWPKAYWTTGWPSGFVPSSQGMRSSSFLNLICTKAYTELQRNWHGGLNIFSLDSRLYKYGISEPAKAYCWEWKNQ